MNAQDTSKLKVKNVKIKEKEGKEKAMETKTTAKKIGMGSEKSTKSS
jgi:hypothetical protein